jgi:phosphatidylglycerophosphate synthase
MINSFLIIVIVFTLLVLIFFWYARYASKSGFALDENKNDIPDSWEGKFNILFKFKNIIILLLGVLIGYLLSLSSLL